jgi:hypothetical protein
MKTLIASLVAIAALAGAANAVPLSQNNALTVVEYGCGRGH